MKKKFVKIISVSDTLTWSVFTPAVFSPFKPNCGSGSFWMWTKTSAREPFGGGDLGLTQLRRLCCLLCCFC